ncbi:MAG: hypothetical protein JWM45_711, partial [Pseudonocardiales bacterium]|nr:hypothetical protein [Pseudonocardiales bacterium]
NGDPTDIDTHQPFCDAPHREHTSLSSKRGP